MSKQQEPRDMRTPHTRLVCTLAPSIYTPITPIEHQHSTLVKNFELVNGQPVSITTSRKSDSIKNMSKYTVGDFSIITLDNIGIQSLRPQHYTPNIDAMLASIK
jgi:hypothetical protein